MSPIETTVLHICLTRPNFQFRPPKNSRFSPNFPFKICPRSSSSWSYFILVMLHSSTAVNTFTICNNNNSSRNIKQKKENIAEIMMIIILKVFFYRFATCLYVYASYCCVCIIPPPSVSSFLSPLSYVHPLYLCWLKIPLKTQHYQHTHRICSYGCAEIDVFSWRYMRTGKSKCFCEGMDAEVWAWQS